VGQTLPERLALHVRPDAYQGVLFALARMLELRLLGCDVAYDPNTSSAQYAYHWTYLGRQAARQIDIVKSAVLAIWAVPGSFPIPGLLRNGSVARDRMGGRLD
jgi:hypothetical protein